MSKRVKPEINVTVIKSLDEANDILGRIAALQRNIKLIETALNDDIDALKLKASVESEPYRRQIAELGEALGRYAVYNKPELFKDRKSCELTFGSFGFRSSSRITLAGRKDTWEQVTQSLKEMGMLDFIRVKYEPDKDALKGLSDIELKRLGCKLVQEDKFFYELSEQELAEGGAI
ncbi:MAG: host-nuclease inhibitor Gam family protein [Deltaproteobacteria bacterium]|jgi:phage host-nuclease inhibitor protein Gam|nr:host-nuclease inhibitor Gam family protein [Deltaproteobacteria bacterium]